MFMVGNNYSSYNKANKIRSHNTAYSTLLYLLLTDT